VTRTRHLPVGLEECEAGGIPHVQPLDNVTPEIGHLGVAVNQERLGRAILCVGGVEQIIKRQPLPAVGGWITMKKMLSVMG